MVDKFIDYLTEDWTPEDWKNMPRNDLFYYVSEWLESGGDISDLFQAKFEFEKYMGW